MNTYRKENQIGARIKQARKAKKLNQEEVANACGISRAAVSLWESQTQKPAVPSPDNLLVVAKLLNTTIDWILTGQKSLVVNEDRPIYHDVTSGPVTKGLVPLISWVQAGAWHDAETPSDLEDPERLLPCVANHGPQTYALRVSGDSMTAQHGKSYPSGCVIYVDPDQAGAVTSGDRVIAKINGDSKVTFKQYIDDAGVKFLKPLNPQYPTIHDPFRIIGKIIGKWEDE